MADLFAHLTADAWDAPATHMQAVSFSGAPVTLDTPCRWFGSEMTKSSLGIETRRFTTTLPPPPQPASSPSGEVFLWQL